MPSTNTTYFLSESDDCICPLGQTDTTAVEIGFHSQPDLPYTRLSTNPNLIGDLFYTISFVVVFAFIRLRGKDLFYNLLNVIIKRKKVEIILNDGISSNLIFYIFSLGLSFSILAGCISLLIYDFFLTVHTLYYFLGFIVYHFSLIIVIQLLGWTFHSKHAAQEMIVNLWAYHIISGLLISPFAISIFFVQNFAVIPLLKIVIFILGLLIIAKFIREIEILFIHKVSILYMILYLCAFEIIPLLALYKVVG